MIKFGQYQSLNETANEALRILVEMSDAEARAFLKKHIETASADKLNAMIQAMERPAIEAKVSEVFSAKQLDPFIDKAPWDSLVKEVLRANGDVSAKLKFLDGLIKGDFIDPKAFINAKTGNVNKFVKTNDPIMKQLYPWLLKWKPEIDTSGVAVGPAEAIFIFTAADGKKGDPAGDVYMGGKVCEMKVSGGSMGKKGETKWTATKPWFLSTVKKLVPGLADEDDKKILKMAPMGGGHKQKSIAINTLSKYMKMAGVSDNDIAGFWMAWIKQATNAKLKKPIKVSKGVVDYDSFVRYHTGCGYEAYRKQTGFYMVSLVDKHNGDFINFITGEDFMDRSDYLMDASMDWNGGGQGGGLTARLMLPGGTHPTIRSEMDEKLIKRQYQNIKAIGDKVAAWEKKPNDRTKATIEKLVKALKVSPRLPHDMFLTAQVKNKRVIDLINMNSKADISDYIKKIVK